MSPVSTNVEALLLSVLIQLIVIIGAARIFGILFGKIGQPQVCGEIAAGLLLGPSVLGRIAPGLSESVFSSSLTGTFNILSQIGLIFLLFLIGLEFDFSHLKTKGKAAATISVTGVAAPFLIGLLIAEVLYPVTGAGTNKVGFSLFLATALSITAIPVLGRILLELKLHRTETGALAITAAAFGDVTGWILLAMISAIVRSEFSLVRSVLMIIETAVFTIVMFNVVRPLLRRWIRSQRLHEGENVSLATLTLILVLVLVSAVLTNLIGISSVFGPFVAGVILYDEDRFRGILTTRFRDFIIAFFLPIFFAYTGLRTDIGSLSGGVEWLLCGLVLIAATVGKFGGCTLAARWTGLSWRYAATIGALMNTRGLMELIVINLGYELGVIPRSVFFMLVFMAVVTTYITTPLVRRMMRNPLATASQ